MNNKILFLKLLIKKYNYKNIFHYFKLNNYEI